MNGRFEDKLAQLAFGELSPEEAARIEAQIANDPAARRTLASYQTMKGGLGALHEVPEDQLSKERLRHAILMSGLKPKPEKQPAYGWLWMPAAAFLLAAGVMLLQGPRTGNTPPVVAINESSLPKETVAIKAPEPRPMEKKKPSIATMVAVNETKPRLLHRSRVPREESADVSELRLTRFEGFEDPSGLRYPGPSVVADNNSGSKLPETPKVDSEVPKDAAATTIVIIDNNVDETTGANRATEGTASNVLIGG